MLKNIAETNPFCYNDPHMSKIVTPYKSKRREKEREVLFGLIELYLKEGRPVGSNTLKESGFDHLSSATIRNYCAELEEDGLLIQHHTSGGRIPTDKAYRLYAEAMESTPLLSRDDDLFLSSLLLQETKEIPSYLQEVTEALSEITGLATFLMAPRLDQDFITDIKLLKVDDKRVLAALVTDFGLVHTQILYLPKKMSNFSLKRIEEYFQSRLHNRERPALSHDEEHFAKQSYNEIVLRHFIKHTNKSSEEIHKGGFSKLLLYPEFHDPAILTHTLSLFENKDAIRFFLQESFTKEKMVYWIGDDLKEYMPTPYLSSVIVIPYRIHQKIVGSIAVLGPNRIPYPKIFGFLNATSKYLSENLTKSMYKFKLTFRQQNPKAIDLRDQRSEIIGLPYQTEKKYDI